VLTAALAVIAPVLTAKNRELAQANTDLTRANDEVTATNEKLTEATTAAREDFDDASVALLGMAEVAQARRGGGVEDPVQASQRDALAHYRDFQKRFIARNRNRPEAAVGVATAWLKVAEAEYSLGRLAEAEEAATEAERLFAALKAERPDDRDMLFGWACAVQHQGFVRADRGQLSAAEPALTSASDAFERLANDPTPLRLTRLGDVGKVAHRDSPSFRRAAVLSALAEVREQVKRTEQATGVPGKTGGGYRTELRAAVTALTGDKPLPPDAPLTTRLTDLLLRFRIAVLDPDPDAGCKTLLALSDEAVTAFGRYPAIVEFLSIAVEAELAVGQAEMARARGLWAAVMAADKAGQQAEVNRLGQEWEKALATANQRLTQVAGMAEELERANVAPDLTEVRSTAAAVQAEVGVQFVAASEELNRTEDLTRNLSNALAALKRLTEQKKVSPDAAGRGVLAAIALASTAHIASKKKPAPGETADAHAKRMKALQADAATAIGYAVALNDRLLDLSPTEPRYRRMKAYLYVSRLDVAGDTSDPIGRLVERAEEAIRPLRDDKTEWFDEFVDALLLNSRAVIEGDTNNNPAGAVPLLEQAVAKLDEAERAGMPGEGVDLLRLMFTTTTAAALCKQAEEALDGPAADRPKAAQLVARGLDLIRESEKVVVREDPDPDIQRRLVLLRGRRGDVKAELEKLDARANLKK
jgi:hypothetical protein